MDEWPRWAGDLPTWITTAAIALAAIQIFAERKKRAAEETRESKSQASELTAWAVSDPKNAMYGIVFSNTSRSTFHDVEIVAMIHGEILAPVQLRILPPGSFFVRLAKKDASEPGKTSRLWDYPIDTSEYQGELRPYMNTDRYQVMSMSFRDNLKQSWETDAQALLTRS